MGKVDTGKYGSSRPKLTPDDLEGGNVAILTVATFDDVDLDFDDRDRVSPFITFEETGDKVLWLNKTQVEYLIQGFGSDDSDSWIGKKVPVERHTAKFKGQEFEKLYISPPESWPGLLKMVKGSKNKGGKRK